MAVAHNFTFDSFGLKLPFNYESFSISMGARPVGFRFSKYITDIAVKLNGQDLVVCGESNESKSHSAKAFSELVERSALLTYGSFYGAKTSNGWAAHPVFSCARENAIFELVERHTVLSSWYSKSPFIQIAPETFPESVKNFVRDELSQSEFPILKILISISGLGSAVTCLLMNEKGYGVSAHSTKRMIEDSISSAIAEACRAAHLAIRRAHWNDTLKLKQPRSGPVDPSAHSLYYAYHEPFPAWMFGETMSLIEVALAWKFFINNALNDKRFTFFEVMQSPLFVGFAMHPNALKLTWESTDIEKIYNDETFKKLQIRKETFNEKPHIVS